MSLALILLTAIAPAGDPAVTVRITAPGQTLESVLALFKGARAADPATALANWKRATKGMGNLGKGPEAAIAAMNPSMVRELATLDGSRFDFDFAEDDGAASWSFTVPKDDGTCAAFATAMALTDGQSEPPLNGAEVDRLGKDLGTTLMARLGETVIVADSREALSRALARPLVRDDPAQATGKLDVRISAKGLTRSSRPIVRGAGEALIALGSPAMEMNLALEDGGLRGVGIGPRLGTGAISVVDPAWLDEIPESASAAFAIAIDGRPDSWTRLFEALDRVERADPANRARSPLRPRIGLAARAAGVDLERDLWPKVRGASGFVVGSASKPEGVAVAIHLADAESARTFRDRVLPQLAKTLGLAPGAGRTVWLSARSPKTVWIGRGVEGVPIGAREGPTAKLVDSIAAKDRESIPTLSRWGWIVPGRLGLAPAGSPMAAALDACGPARWEGRDNGKSSTDVVIWEGLDRGVRRFLELVPQEPTK